jgi:hypothetical protein
MASRFEAFKDLVEAAYAGAADTTWLFGAKHIFDHHNWNRIVVWPGIGFIRAPVTGAQGITTETGGRDDIVWNRNPQMSFGIWAEDTEQAENRLHAVLIAIDDVLSQADIKVANLNENWVEAESQDNTTDGATVVLTMNVAFDVLARDVDIVAYDAATSPTPPRPEVGDGGPTETVTQVTIKTPDETDVPDKVIT